MLNESMADRDPREVLLEFIDAWREKQPERPSRAIAVDYLIKNMGLDPALKDMLLDRDPKE